MAAFIGRSIRESAIKVALQPINFSNFPSIDHRKRVQQPGDKRHQIVQSVADRAQDWNGKRPPRNPLLILQALVDGDEGIELSFHGVQQLAIRETAPAHGTRVGCFVSGYMRRKPPRNTVVDENPHGRERLD